MAKFDPRKIGQVQSTVPKTAPQAQPQAQPAWQMPAAEGTILGAVPADQAGHDNLTELERRVLAQAGAEGVPGVSLGNTAFAQRLAAQIEQMRSQPADLSGVDQTKPPITPPVAVPFDALPPAEQASVQAKMESAMQYFQAQSPPQAPQAQPAAFTEASQAELQELREQADAQRQAAEAVAASETPNAIGHIPGMAQAWQAANAVVEDDLDTPAPQQTDAELNESAQQPSTPAICPHCFCELRVEAEEITTEDKIAYLQGLFGGRFTKTYSVFGGRLRFVLRTLSPAEIKAVERQLSQDAVNKHVLTLHDLREQRTYYYMAASLQEILYADGRGKSLPVVSDMITPDGDATPFPALLEAVTTHVISNDSVWRTYEKLWNKFMRLSYQLDAKKDLDDFFTGIAPVR